MKILVISNMYPSRTAPNYGTFVKNFCDQLDELNIKYDKIVMTKQSNKIIAYFKYYIKVILKIFLNNYDVLYVHYASHNALLVLFINKFKKIEIYTNVHGGDVVPQTKAQKFMQKYTKKLLEISNKIIVPSTYFRKVVSEKYQLPESKIKIYPSAGVDENLFYPFSLEEKKRNLLDGFELKEDIHYIGYVGRIENGKGWDTLLEAIYILKSENKINDKRFVIIGNGNEYSQFNKMINELNLTNYIIRKEYLPQDKLPVLYNSLSLFCFPTRRKESLGLVALEALACGIPVIASDFAAPKHYIIDGYNGFKFQKGNPYDLAKKINLFFELDIIEVKKLQNNAHLTGSKYYKKNIRDKLLEIVN